MQRRHLSYLIQWLHSHDRKPMVIRGARQVGKTWIVRECARLSQKRLIEVNFEERRDLISLFQTNDVKQILKDLSAALLMPIKPEDCILFLDEIQAVPELIAKLRWFAEKLPILPVIAAGSLLEFVLADHSFSMPVGRITYMHLEPFSFLEFLTALDLQPLVDYVESYSLSKSIPIVIHEQLSKLFKEYVLVGGMPAAVSNWCSEQSFQSVNLKHHDLLTTYRDDFSKYNTRILISTLDETLLSVPQQLAKKYSYSKVSADINSSSVKLALNLLNKARVCSPVICSAGNGVPIGAEINKKYFKEIFVDVGLCSTCLGLELNQISKVDELIMINRGGIAEQVAGQLLRTLFPPYVEPKLYYWQRTEKGAEAEVDYLIQHGSTIIPVEVKAGSTGTLKSLHIYMGLKKFTTAVRINSDLPSQTDIDVNISADQSVRYILKSIPFYLLSELHRLIDESE